MICRSTSIISCDVLIIGSGSAGLRSAIEAHDSGVENVLIISQSRKGDPPYCTCKRWHQCSPRYMDSEDNWMIHSADTLREGEYLAEVTEHGGVWLDVTHLPKEKILERLSTMYEQFKNLNGIDISKDKMEVGPTAHYSMGGIVVDIKCRTIIRGLFAVGEIISRIHGANRLGGNSLLDTIVFGKMAGYEAATFAKENSEKQKVEKKGNKVVIIKI